MRINKTRKHRKVKEGNPKTSSLDSHFWLCFTRRFQHHRNYKLPKLSTIPSSSLYCVYIYIYLFVYVNFVFGVSQQQIHFTYLFFSCILLEDWVPFRSNSWAVKLKVLEEEVDAELVEEEADLGLNFMDNFWWFGSQLPGGRSLHGSGKGRSHQGPIKYGFSLVKAKANHPMEDYHVAKFVQYQGRELGLFAIYDGHLGDSVPAYLQKHLFHNILKEEEFWTDTNRSISKAYERTDQAILSHSPDLGRGGSTAVTAILMNGRKLWVANVGDSRAVLSRGGQAIQMTIDHEPNIERDSIENKGGFVSNMPGDVARVNGQLAVSRAFGDKNLKSHLRSDPDVTNADIDVDTDLLILASDGLWKVMSNQEAVDIAKKIKEPLKAAKQLAAEALNRESKDDISCVVVRFKA